MVSGAEKSDRPVVSILLLLTFQALVAASSLSVEIVAGRMLAPYVGMSLYTWTAVIAVVLAGLSIGHWAGGFLADQTPSKSLRNTGIVLMVAAISTAVAVPLLSSVAGPLSRLTSDPAVEIVTLCLVVFLLPSVFAGIPSPVFARLCVLGAPTSQGKSLGNIFAAGAIGAIAGTLLTGYFFIPWLGTVRTLAAIAITYGAMGLYLIIRSRQAGYLATSLALAGLLAGVSMWSLNHKQACDTESQYYCIRIVDYSSEAGEPARLMVLDHLGHSINLKDRLTRLEMPYQEAFDRLAKARFPSGPTSSFFIGGGAYTLPRAWSHAGIRDITVAEIDPAATRVAMSQMWFDPSGINIVHGDARRVLSRQARRFDMVLGDAFTDIAIPSHLVTVEFFKLVSNRLNDNGVYAMNVVDNAARPHALLSIVATLKHVFGHVRAFAQVSDAAGGGRTTFAVFASQSSLPEKLDDPDATDTRRFEAVSQAWFDQTIRQRDPVILRDDFAPIDRLVRQGAT